MSESWEQRMAAKATARAEADREADHAAWVAAVEAAKDHPAIQEHLDSMEMTVEDARFIRSNPSGIGCACIGCPPDLRAIPGAPCYCTLSYMRVDQLLGGEPSNDR